MGKLQIAPRRLLLEIIISCPATIYDCSTTQMYVILFFLEVSYFKILSFFKIQI